MEINNHDTIKLPDELQRKIEQARNSLTLAEQETIRLNELKYQQESDIKDNLGRIDTLKKELEELEKSKEMIKSELKLLSSSVENSHKVLEENTIKANQIIKELADKEADINQRQDKIIIKEKEIVRGEKALIERSSELEKKQTEVNKKAQIIKDFAKII